MALVLEAASIKDIAIFLAGGVGFNVLLWDYVMLLQGGERSKKDQSHVILPPEKQRSLSRAATGLLAPGPV
jgi:hypothetical protein